MNETTAMITVNLNDELSAAIEKMAQQQHKSAEQLINDAVLEMLTDYRGIRAAEAPEEHINRDEERTYSLAEAEQYFF